MPAILTEVRELLADEHPDHAEFIDTELHEVLTAAEGFIGRLVGLTENDTPATTSVPANGVEQALFGEIGRRHRRQHGVTLDVHPEIRRGAPRLTAGSLARYAQFFSFGTNDLTQTTSGFSRDDVKGSFFSHYLDRGIFGVSPFETLDADGVGRLIRMAADEGRAARPDLKLGVCGEHGGDPASIPFFHHAGVDYISCSPFGCPSPVSKPVAPPSPPRDQPAGKTRRTRTAAGGLADRGGSINTRPTDRSREAGCPALPRRGAGAAVGWTGVCGVDRLPAALDSLGSRYRYPAGPRPTTGGSPGSDSTSRRRRRWRRRPGSPSADRLGSPSVRP